MGKDDRVSLTKAQEESQSSEIKMAKTDPATRNLVTTTFGSMGEVSDGYHTFNELYKTRMLLNAALFNAWMDKPGISPVKSHKHSDGEKPFGGGWFIVVAQLPTGQVSWHYEDKHWGLFKIKEVERAPKWDGHTAEQAIERLEKYITGS